MGDTLQQYRLANETYMMGTQGINIQATLYNNIA